MFYIDTDRTFLTRIHPTDAEFVVELLNTDGWLRYVGDRNVFSKDDARTFIQANFISSYLKDGFGFLKIVDRISRKPIGICGMVQRKYFDYPDLGFALLPEFEGRSLAKEAAAAYVDMVRKNGEIPTLMAQFKPENIRSKKLLEKLGFKPFDTMNLDGEELEVYRLDFTGK